MTYWLLWRRHLPHRHSFLLRVRATHYYRGPLPLCVHSLFSLFLFLSRSTHFHLRTFSHAFLLTASYTLLSFALIRVRVALRIPACLVLDLLC
jgi:hypothetical protein